MTGKGIIDLKSTNFDDDSVIGVPIYNKKIQRIVGYVYVKVSYTPRKLELFDDEWLLNLETVSKIDKYQYFDTYLTNEFKNICHVGYLQA